MNPIEPLRRLLLLLAIILLSSCDGVTNLASDGGVGTGGTGITSGTVTGFGSLVVDGESYSSASASYLAGSDVEESAQVSALSVDLGQQVQMQLDADGNPAMVLVDAALIGAVGSVDAFAGRMVVNDVNVRVNASASLGPVTYYAGLAGLASLAAGAQVEVHGLYGVDSSGSGYIQATRIKLLSASNTATRITGVVEGLDAVRHLFTLAGTTIRYDAATLQLPPGMSLTNGQLVNVWSPVAPIGDSMTVEVIRIRTLRGNSGPVVMSGLVANLTGNQFTLSGIAVDASAANLAATVSSLTPGQYVVISGEADAATGRLTAMLIRTVSALPVRIELKGTLTEYVSAASFVVRGVTVDASSASFEDGAATLLKNGAYVEVHGVVQGNVVSATSVSIESAPPDGSTVEYVGTVSGLVGRSFILTLRDGHSLPVTLATNVGYEEGSASGLINGVRVEIEATSSSAGLLAYGISFKDTDEPDDDEEREVSGIAYDVTATSFVVNGLTILINGLDVDDLANGVEVEVHFTIDSNGVYLATEIEVED